MKDERWDEYINLGDFMDFDQLSSFNKTALRKLEGRVIQEDYDIGNEILDRHQKAIRKKNKKAKFVMIEGNHDFRVEKYIDEHPQLRHSIEVEKGLRLKERGFKWVRNWSQGEVYSLGSVLFLHGLYVGQSHAKKMLEAYGTGGKSVVYGHTHDCDFKSKVCFGSDNVLFAQSLGCLCDYEQEYMGKKPSNWINSFGVFHFREDGSFNHYVVRIQDHTFTAPNGKTYKG